jgi:ABC-type transporter MlaC component
VLVFGLFAAAFSIAPAIAQNATSNATTSTNAKPVLLLLQQQQQTKQVLAMQQLRTPLRDRRHSLLTVLYLL